jgi:hypothetical protein
MTTMIHKLIFGECDCCTKPNRVLHRCEAYGIETYACAECRHCSLSDDIDEIEDEIERIRVSGDTSAYSIVYVSDLREALKEAIHCGGVS